MKKKGLRMVAMVAALGVVAVLAAYWYGFMRKEKPMEKMKVDYTLSADSLFSLFSANEKSATDRFGGRILVVTAPVVSVEQDARGNTTVTLVDPLAGVTCTIDSAGALQQREEIASLAEGKSVKIKGRCDGMLSDVKLSRCIIVH